MATGARQQLITQLVSEVVGLEPEVNKSFAWLLNKHTAPIFKGHFDIVNELFITLKGDSFSCQTKQTRFLACDAYFGGSYHFIFEFDEFQHFSTPRLRSLEKYPANLPLQFKLEEWKKNCQTHLPSADKYRYNKLTKEFAFAGGRTAQRAYLDTFKDLLPPLYGLQPTLRISEFEVSDIIKRDKYGRGKIEILLKEKMG